MVKIIDFLSLLVLLLLCSCSTAIDNPHRIRVSAESKNGAEIEFKVFTENSYGNCMTGASVLVANSSNEITTLLFDNNSQCYKGNVDGVARDTYNIKVNSVVFDGSETMSIPHQRLFTKPEIISFMDSGGASVLAGQNLSHDKEFEIAWNSLGEEIVYQVTIKTALTTVWSASTEAATIHVPGNILESGKNYYLYVIAQKIYGDPFFEKENYYSVSSISSAGITFYVE